MTRVTLAGSNVRGATGMSRKMLRQYIFTNGLFGRDSSLTASQQTTVRSAFQVGGCSQSLELVPDALQIFATAAVLGEGSVAMRDWDRAIARGLDRYQLAEVLAVVGLVKEAFGLAKVSVPRIDTVDRKRRSKSRIEPAAGILHALPHPA